YKVENNKFNLFIGGDEIETNVEYDEGKYKISFTNESIRKRYRFKYEFKTDEDTIKKDENLINYLNQYQEFQIVTADGSHVYYNGQFFKCNIPFDKEPLEPILEEYKLTGEKRIENEKGDYSVVRDEW